jgi:hypothetical protein
MDLKLFNCPIFLAAIAMQFGCYFKTNETFFSKENVKDLGLAEFTLSHVSNPETVCYFLYSKYNK